MSETLNINVLVAAKEEYTKQLVYILSPEIYIVLKNVYNESQLMKKKRSISLRNYQVLLKRIPVWNTILIEQHTKDIKTKIPYLLDLITAIFVSHVKILACVRLKADSKSIQVKVPNLDTFLHKIIITNAEKIYYNPDTILKKKEIVIELVSETIEETIRNQIPIDKILTEYLAGVFDEENNNNQQINNLSKINNEEEELEDDEEEEELEELEELEDDEEEESEDDEEDEQKNIVPTRPLPQMLLPENESNNDNGNESTLPEDKIPTTEIKQKERVLFSDAMEKSLKDNNNNDDDEEEEDSGSEIEYDSE
jgi:hypothetical protein